MGNAPSLSNTRYHLNLAVLTIISSKVSRILSNFKLFVKKKRKPLFEKQPPFIYRYLSHLNPLPKLPHLATSLYCGFFNSRKVIMPWGVKL